MKGELLSGATLHKFNAPTKDQLLLDLLDGGHD